MAELADAPTRQARCGDDESTLRQLLVASEIFPLAKTGGLADVCGALPKAIARLGIDVRLIMPAYPEALERLVAPRQVADLAELLPGVSAHLIAGSMPGSGLPVWLVDCPELFDRPGTPYQDPSGCDWEDNAQRFGVLCHAAARVALGQAIPDWRADVVHAHDWHAGLVPLLLLLSGQHRPRTVFTVHNAAFQGNFPLDRAELLGLPQETMTPDGIEFYGQLSFLKAGVRYADKVTTVSPTYANEICTSEFGFGMEGLFRARRADLVGILNGIDAEQWDPRTDPYLSHHYSRDDLRGKQSCKARCAAAPLPECRCFGTADGVHQPLDLAEDGRCGARTIAPHDGAPPAAAICSARVRRAQAGSRLYFHGHALSRARISADWL